MANRVRSQADNLCCTMSRMSVRVVEMAGPPPAVEARTRSTLEEPDKLLNTLLGLMQAMQPQAARSKQGRDREKVFHKPGEELENIPLSLKPFMIVPNPEYGQCWYCGEKRSKHRLITCLKRLQEEIVNLGSSLAHLENE